MKPKNNGQKEDIILQKKFTTYVELAAKRRRKDYFVLQYRDMEISSSLEEFDVACAFDFEYERLEGSEILVRCGWGYSVYRLWSRWRFFCHASSSLKITVSICKGV